MEYITLNNGVKMPIVGFGTWDIRGEEGKRCILEALEVGYRLIDTAAMYNNESIVGAAMKESGLPRSEIFLTTKLNAPYAGYEKAKAGIAESLAKLQSDYIDLLLIHEPYDQAEGMYEAFKEAYQAGKVRAIGVSNFYQRHYCSFVQSCGVIPAVDQVESHVYFPELSLKKTLNAHGTMMQSWGPFTEGRRNIFSEPLLNKIGQKYHKSAAQVALRFLIQNGIAVIPKSAHKERMKENLDIFDFALSPEDIKEISTLDTHRSLFGWY